jgi:RNA polymerase sigma-70 factor (ECF subfamily)
LIFREVEDRDLILKAQRGDVDAYNLLVSRWEKRVFNYLLRLVRNREDAMDLCQDVLLKVYQNLRKLEDPARFAPLLRKKKPEDDLETSGYEMPNSMGGGMLPVETALAVDAALRRLTEEQREAVVLKVYQGFKFEEMSEILGCPLSTVKSRLYTALELLKDTLAPVGIRGSAL